MCWNKDVSLNTFLFSMFVLCLIIYNNGYTKYKIEELNNKWIYLFMLSFISMQLIEYFIWVNVKNPLYNSIFTGLATLLVLFQPIASIMLITDNKWKLMLYSYLLFIMPVIIYKFNINHINTDISKLGHLRWNTIIDNSLLDIVFGIIWLFFFLFPLFYEGHKLYLIIGIVTLLLTTYNYYNDKTIGSMWCWIVNIVMIYFAGYLLFWLPFFK